MGAFRQHRIVLGHLGGNHRALRERDIGRRGNHLLRRREGSSVPGMDGGALLGHPGQARARAELVGVDILPHLVEAHAGVQSQIVGDFPFVLHIAAEQPAELGAGIEEGDRGQRDAGRIERLAVHRIARESGVDARDERALGARGESKPKRMRIGYAPGGILLDAVNIALTVHAG